MSPSEEQLRNALHRDEPQAPDADAIIGRAQQVRRSRRFNRLTAAGAVACVLAVAGVVVGIRDAGTGPATSSSLAISSDAGAGASGGEKAGALTPPINAPLSAQSEPRSVGSTCPTAPPDIGLNPDPGLWAGTLMPLETSYILICVFQPLIENPSSLAGQAAVGGTDAANLAARLNSLPTPARGQACPALAGPVMLLIAEDPSGNILGRVRADIGNCRDFTNGTAARAGEDLYRQLLLLAVPGATGGSAGATGGATHGPGPAS